VESKKKENINYRNYGNSGWVVERAELGIKTRLNYITYIVRPKYTNIIVYIMVMEN